MNRRSYSGSGRRLRLSRLLVGLAALVLGGLVVTVGTAATADDTGDGTAIARFSHVDFKAIGKASTNWVPASLSEKVVTVMVQVDGEPVALRQADAQRNGEKLSPAERAGIRADLKNKQDSLTPAIQGAGGEVVGQLQDAYNGVLVKAKEKDLAQLAAIAGVAGVHRLPTYHPTNVHGVPYIGADKVWNGTRGSTGAGIKIAIIDTGIDYYHANLGGAGNANDFKNANGTTLADGGFPNAKVVGGYDFVGDAYNASSADPAKRIPHPDPDPLDCNGHGSHVAGTAAGNGVKANGAAFNGPYNASTLSDPNAFRIGPGVAPKALIYAYRVFGCTGSSEIVAQAINRAVADGVDVISMSLGSDFGSPDDPTAVAAENAAAAGISVVAAAGNGGPSGYITGSPASASRVISVAAVDGSVPTYPGANLALSTGKVVTAIDANGAPIPAGTHPVKVLRNADGSVSLGCDPAQYTGVAGAVVVTVRGTCARVARAIYGQNAGAAAVVMINTATTLPPYEGPIRSNPDTGQPANVTIPFLGVRGVLGTGSDGDAVVAADGGTVTLTSTTVANDGYRRQASFSSGGPRNEDSALKPDVTAPGVSVVSTGMGTGNDSATISGTSMATPMTAGSAALVLAAHPEWKTRPALLPDRVKAALMNTADPTAAKLLNYNVRISGSGVVQAQKAVATVALATTADHLENLSFAYVPGSGSYTATKQFTISNLSGSSISYNIAAAFTPATSFGAVSVSPSSVTVPGNGSSDVNVTLSISTAQFAAMPSDSTFSIGLGAVFTLRGAVTATPTSSGAGLYPLRVPFLVVPRGLSDVTAGAPGPFTRQPNGTSGSTVQLHNGGIHTGTADVYAWGISDPSEGGQPMDVRAAGIQVQPREFLCGSDPVGTCGTSNDRSLVLAINTWGKATNQSVNEYDVAVDTNGDGNPDFFVVGADIGVVLTGSFDGRFGSFVIDAKTGALVDVWVAEAPMNGSTIELPFLASEIGLDGKRKSALSYTVTAFSIIPGPFVDTTGSAWFDVYHPAASSGDFLTLAPGANATLPLRIDNGQQGGNGNGQQPGNGQQGVLGWLVVSVDDANGAAQAEQIPAPSDLK